MIQENQFGELIHKDFLTMEISPGATFARNPQGRFRICPRNLWFLFPMLFVIAVYANRLTAATWQDASARSFDGSHKVFFDPGGFANFEMRLAEGSREKLEQEDRPYARAELSFRFNEAQGNCSFGPRSVGVKLKGAAGSFQGLDEKPGLTVRLDKFRSRKEHVLGETVSESTSGSLSQPVIKFHLNNSVQDETYFNEWLGSEVFRIAGYPIPAVSQGLLKLDDAPERLVVIREGYDQQFLDRHYLVQSGNLYDGGFCQDIEQPLEKDAGDGPEDHRDLRAIVEALDDPDYEQRLGRVEALVDMDRFLTFMALERILCHWDGYSNSANNYRLFIPVRSDVNEGQEGIASNNSDLQGAIFLPHGMDQLFGDLGMNLFDPNGSMLARHVMGSNALRKKYRARLEELKTLLDPPESLLEALERRFQVVREGAQSQGEEFIQFLDEQQQGLVQRIRERATNITEQLSAPEETPWEIAVGQTLRIEGWYPSCDNDAIRAEVRSFEDLPETLHVRIPRGGEGFGSWRANILLERGEYHLRGRYQVRRLQSIAPDAPETLVVGTNLEEMWSEPQVQSVWQEVELPIRIVEDQRHVECVLGIRSKSGELWIDLDSFQLERLSDQ